MSKILKIITSILIIVIMIIQFSTICFAVSTPVTEQNLREALQKFVSSDANEKNYNVTVDNNSIILSVDNETYTLKYDLSNKATFSFEIPIEKGMSYDKLEKQTDNLISTMVGYIAVANIQGVAVEDASAYFLSSYLENALNGSFSFDSSNSYMIIDDTNIADGVTIETTNPNAIYVSQFGERVMEYVNAVYPESQFVSDSEGINSYRLSVERKDTTETSCKLVSTLSVNLDADFSKIIGYAQKMEDSFMNSDILKENVEKNDQIEQNQVIEDETLNNSDITEIPQTGKKLELEDILLGILFGTIVIFILYYMYNRRKNENE